MVAVGGDPDRARRPLEAGARVAGVHGVADDLAGPGRPGHGGLVVAHHRGVGPGLVQRDQVGGQVAGAAELAAEQVRPSPVAHRELVQARRPDPRVGGRPELVAGSGRDHGRGDGGADAAALPGCPVDAAVLDGAAEATDGGGVVAPWPLGMAGSPRAARGGRPAGGAGSRSRRPAPPPGGSRAIVDGVRSCDVTCGGGVTSAPRGPVGRGSDRSGQRSPLRAPRASRETHQATTAPRRDDKPR